MDLTQWSSWTAPFTGLWQDLAPLLPRVSAALAVLLLGLAFAAGLRAVVRGLLQALGLDARLANLWLFQLWNRKRLGLSPSQSFGNLAFNGAIFLAAVVAIRVLGAGMGSGIFSSLMNVVPQVLSVVLILLLGTLMAAFVSAMVQLVMAGNKLPHGLFWGKTAAWATFGASVMFSLQPLGLAGQILGEAILIGIGALGLALGLAFGLGCKDLAKEFLVEMIKADKEA